MSLTPVRLLAVLLLGAAVTTLVADDKKNWTGKKVMAKTGPPKIGFGKVVVGTVREAVMTVLADKNGKLKVRSGGVTGWFKKSDAVLLEDAPAYFTGAIRTNANNAWAYAMRAVAWHQKGEVENALK